MRIVRPTRSPYANPKWWFLRLVNGRLGVAVVGLGVGEQHAAAYLSDSRCRLKWVYDIDLLKAKDVASRLGVEVVAENYEQILDDPAVHLVSIASYDDAHFEQVVGALNAGKHVFVEKPICQTLSELETIQESWSKYGGELKLTSNLVLRQAPVYQWLKDKIGQRDFGELYAFDGDYLYGRLDKITGGWRKCVENYSVMSGGGVHLIDLMVWMTGQRPESVYALGNRICSAETAFRYNDYVTATFQFPSGFIARITANFGCVHRHQHVVKVFGTDATFIYDDAGARLHTTREPSIPVERISLGTLPVSKGELIHPFVSAILQNEDINTHTQEIFDTIRICSAVESSLESGSVVPVEYA